MNTENYAVIELPKEDQKTDVLSGSFDTVFFDDFDKAFDCFNEKISTEGVQIFKQPKFAQPMRASLANYDVELWIIKRTNQLVKQ